MSVYRCMGSILDDLARVEGLKSQGASVEGSASKILEGVKERLRNGDSSGDPVRDYLIVCGRLGDDSFESRVRLLRDDIASHVGEQVLLYGCNDGLSAYSSDPRDRSLHEWLRLGVIKSESFFGLSGSLKDVRNPHGGPSLVIPMDGYAWEGHSFLGYRQSVIDWTFQEGNMPLADVDISRLDNPVMNSSQFSHSRNLERHVNVHGTRLLVGNELVEMYFRIPKNQVWDLVCKRKNGLLDDERLKEVLEDCARLDLSYIQALDLLGVSPPKDFRYAFDARDLSLRVNLMNDLEHLTNTAMTDSDVKAVYGAAAYGSSWDDGAIVPVVGSSDKGVSLKSRGFTNDTNIITALKDALKLSMHTKPWELKPKPGVTINVPEYIRGLCNMYGVTIPASTSMRV